MINSEHLKKCWIKIDKAKGTDAFVEIFFRQLFNDYPETRQLFSGDLDRQKSNLLTTLDNVINGFEYINIIEKEFIQLGDYHKKIGITAEMFNAFNSTILSAANEASDFSLTEDESSAWKSAFEQISNIMLKNY
ncbi:MAG: globin domain-containing protein [Gammaproteobacteria bacterium]|nr:globin domain-containing protein [Gammaproteobacteria bacterium]